MEDISLHILDIAENSIRARAKKIEIIIMKDAGRDLLTIEIFDDGSGMDPETLKQVRNPFFTTKNKKTGLGVPFLAQAAELAGGGIDIESSPQMGTRVKATFRLKNIDRPAIGDMASTIMTLIAGHPDIAFIYEECEGDRRFRMDTREIKSELEDVPINDPAALEAIRGLLRENVIIK